MVRQSDLETLCGSMGIPRSRALAALTKYRGIDDAVQACFDGHFDHIPEDGGGTEDQEGDQEENDELELDEGLASRPASSVGGTPRTDDDEQFDELDEDGGDPFDLDSQGIAPADNDPYRDLDMSKGRKGLVVEVPDAPGDEVQLPSLDDGGDPIPAVKVTQSDFMKGHPEGSEQSHLFGIFQNATSPKIKCPDCSEFSPRTEASQMLVLCDSVTTYLQHARRAATEVCPTCGQIVCAICGEASKSVTQAPRSTDGSLSLAQDPLFHCGEIQAVVVGIGLMHVERLFSEPDGPGALRKGGKSAKRPKRDDVGAAAAAGASASVGVGTSDALSTAAIQTTSAGSPYDDEEDDYEDEYSYGGYPHKSGKKSAAGTGYAGHAVEDTSWIATAAARQAKQDNDVRTSMQLLRHHLPQIGLRKESIPLDYTPHMATVAMLRRRLLPIAAELLRCESLQDMAQPGRAEVYLELLEWMRVFSGSDALGALLAQPIMLEQSSEWQTTRTGVKERHVHYEAKAGPRELAESICVQARTLLRGVVRIEQNLRKASEDSKQGGTESKPEEKSGATAAEAVAAKDLQATLNLKRFCSSFLEQIEKIDHTLVMTKGQGFVDKVLSAVRGEVGGSTKESTMPPQFAECDMQVSAFTAGSTSRRDPVGASWTPATSTDPSASTSEGPHYRHAHDAKIRSTQTSNSKRGLQIAKELATLRVSLPTDAVFLRVDEARQDVLKVLIIGPEDSPYAMGCFAFDIFLPAEYNHGPPLVKIITTSGGRVRFNPNLYAEGKVCLSLLGTWSGPGWQPGRSTILQVLLSIQSLILGVPEPCLNEPGWASYGGTPQSKKYSLNCRRQTVQVAMLENLRDPPFPWEDVIKAHFRCKKDVLLQQLELWWKEDDGRAMYPDGTSVMYSHDPPAISTAAATLNSWSSATATTTTKAAEAGTTSSSNSGAPLSGDSTTAQDKDQSADEGETSSVGESSDVTMASPTKSATGRASAAAAQGVKKPETPMQTMIAELRAKLAEL